jgi:hypothetical protein
LVCADNTPLHTAQASRDFIEAHGMEKESHPTYSPNITPSHFYLFSHVKNRFAGVSFVDVDELLEAVMTILDDIEKVTFETVFLK